MNWFLLTLVVLACARITHLIADDYILSRPRDWYLVKTARYPHLNYLPTCSWCVSIWVAGLAVLLLGDDIGLEGWEYWVSWPALSYAVVLLESFIEAMMGIADDEE